jgi:hypothetical protein
LTKEICSDIIHVMKPQNIESTPTNPNKVKGVAAATGLAVALGAGIVGAAVRVEAPKDTKVESVADDNTSNTTPTTEAPTTTIAVQQHEMQPTPATVVMPEATTTTIAAQPTAETTIPEHVIFEDPGAKMISRDSNDKPFTPTPDNPYPPQDTTTTMANPEQPVPTTQEAPPAP